MGRSPVTFHMVTADLPPPYTPMTYLHTISVPHHMHTTTYHPTVPCALCSTTPGLFLIHMLPLINIYKLTYHFLCLPVCKLTTMASSAVPATCPCALISLMLYTTPSTCVSLPLMS